MPVNNYNISEQKINKIMRKLKNLFSWLKPKPKEIACGCGHISKMEKEVQVGNKKQH